MAFSRFKKFSGSSVIFKLLFKKSLFIVVSIVFILLPIKNFYPQSTATFIFNNEDGLVSNLVKNVVQDKNGYVWIGTDGGLVRFDGKQFYNYNREIPYLSIKDIRLQEDGKIIVVSDYGVGNIEYTGGKYKFNQLYHSATKETNSLIFFPKTVYQDKSGTIWIGDLTGVTEIKNGNFKKYKFARQYNSDSYFRSYNFVEDAAGNLIVSSWQGYLFIFDKKTLRFKLLPFTPPVASFKINAIIYEADGTILLGTSHGLYAVKFSNNYQSVYVQRINSLPMISSLLIDANNNLYLGTWDNGLFIATDKSKRNTVERYNSLHFTSIKNLSLDRSNNVWVSSDEGVALLKKTFFTKVNLSSFYFDASNPSIRQLRKTPNGDIYFNDGKSIFRVDFKNSNYKVDEIFSVNGKEILSFVPDNSGIWISYHGGIIEYRDIRSFNIIHSTKFEGDRANILYVDSKNNFWAYLGKEKKIIKIDKGYRIKYYDFDSGNIISLNVIKEDNDGAIYCGGIGLSAFLFKLDNKLNIFKNVSYLLEHNNEEPLHVYDFYFGKTDSIYLGTSSGLFVINTSSKGKVKVYKEFEQYIVKSVTFDNHPHIWLGTEEGLITRNQHGDAYFIKQDGLPNSSILPEGILFDNKEHLWVTTVSGIAHSYLNPDELIQTEDPRILDIRNIDEVDSVQHEKRQFTAGSSLKFSFISIAYPADRIIYEYKLSGLNESITTTKENSLVFYNLSAGEYSLQIRARNAGRLWSNWSLVKFSVVPHWYLSKFMISVYTLLVIALIYVIIKMLYDKRLQKLKKSELQLSRLVELRTNDLLLEKEKAEEHLRASERAKNELERVNEQKSQLLNITAHDLKNPLQSILGFADMIKDESADESIQNMAKLIKASSKVMLSQITDMLEAVATASKDFHLDKKHTNINKLLTEIIYKNKYRAAQKSQNIIYNSADDISLNVDEGWISTAIENLLSNAIKYSPFGKSIYINTGINERYLYIKVKDEGPGLSQADMSKLFQKFQRLSSKPTGGETSTGLGLSIVKDIVNKHNGEVWAECELGSGCTFIIQLPLTEQE